MLQRTKNANSSHKSTTSRLPRAPRGRGIRAETQLQKAVAIFLQFALPPHVAWTYVPNGEGELSPEQGRRLREMGLKPGWPDLLFIAAGKAYLIELKTEKDEVFGIAAGRVSNDQIAMHAWLRTAGAPVAVCRSVEDVEAALRGWAIPLHARAR
jgi:hypothetical protein